MADDIQATPTPAPVAAPAPVVDSPAPAPQPEQRGIRAMIDSLNPKPETKKVDAPVAPDADAKNEPPVSPTDLSKLPVTEPEIEPAWDKAPKNLRNNHFKFKREMEEKLTKAEAKLKELEGKSNQSPEDLKKIKAAEERIAQLEKSVEERESRLMQADYAKSDEFKRLYIDKGEKAYKRAISELSGLKVSTIDPETQETKTRAAEKSDFDYLRNLTPYEQDKKLQEMFGSSAPRVAWHLNQLSVIENEANEAIQTAREKAAETSKQNDLQRVNGRKELETHSQVAREDLIKTHAAYFAPDPANPEATKALESGFKYVDDAAANAGKMSPKDFAETNETIRALAAAAPRLMVERKQLTDKIKGLEAELSKYRKSSPTAASPSGKSAPVVEEPRGIEAMKAAMLAAK